jgi:hypothetical protein
VLVGLALTETVVEESTVVVDVAAAEVVVEAVVEVVFD